jgi:pimeloyl-ACP methyl ester carboxylesterase
MKNETIILLHGYGVRSWFWDMVKPVLEKAGYTVYAPDIWQKTLPERILALRSLIEVQNSPVILIGHSMGGILSSVLAKELGPEKVREVIILASPFGERQGHLQGVYKFLIKHRLLPGFMVAHRFFSKRIPKEIRRKFFAKAVPEPYEIQDLVFQKRWFHTDILTSGLEQKTVVIASKMDLVVHWKLTKSFAEAIEADFKIYEKQRKVYHNDFVVDPELIQDIVEIVESFQKSTIGKSGS